MAKSAGFLILGSLLLVSVPTLYPLSSSWAQYYADPRERRTFDNYVRRNVTKLHKPAFISDCSFPNSGNFNSAGKALLIFPLGLGQGWIVEIAPEGIWNAGGVRTKRGKLVIYDQMGGNWSIAWMDHLRDYLVKQGFSLVEPNEVPRRIDAPSKSTCPDPTKFQPELSVPSK